MISDELQYQVHLGRQKAFQTLFAQCGRGVYLTLLAALGEERAAREGVKQVFRLLQKELIAAPGPLDLEARIADLTGAQIAKFQKERQEGQRVRQRTWAECFPLGAVPPEREPSPSMAPRIQPPPAQPGAQPSAIPAATAPICQIPPAQPGMQPSAIPAAAAPICQPPAPEAPVLEACAGEAPPEKTPPSPAPSEQERPQAPSPATPAPGSARTKPRRGLICFMWLLVALLCAALLWLFAGILMDIGLLPRHDLGYAWFNKTVYPVFRLQ